MISKLTVIIATILLLSGCNSNINRENPENNDRGNKVETDLEFRKNTIDLGSTKDIKSEIYNKYFKDFPKHLLYGDKESNVSLENDNSIKTKNIFRGNGQYLSFLPEENSFFLDYDHESNDFILSYWMLEGTIVREKKLTEDLFVEIIKSRDNIEVKQENLKGEKVSIIAFDDEYKKEIVEVVKSFTENPLFQY